MKERFAEYHIECPCGKSSDAYCVRQDGSGYCFSCGKNFQNHKGQSDLDVIYEYVGHRGIARKTFEFFDVKTKFIDEVPDSVGFPLGDTATQVRSLSEKKFFYSGPVKESPLFGMKNFDPGSRDSITITEGNFDAMAAYEMLRGESACISVHSASSALSDLRKHWEYINSFNKIYLCLDNDDPGKEATKSLSGLFDFQKVYLVKFHKHKDANDYLVAGDQKEFQKTWQNAKRYAPDNIISSFRDIEKALENVTEDQLGTYPFSGLQSKLYGLHAGEVIVVKAPEGIGKTEFFRALEYHILQDTDHPIGVIHLEEDNGTTVKAIAGYHLETPATLPDCGLSKEDILRGYREAVRDNEGRVHIHSSFDVENETAFLGNIRFLVSAAGCRFVFLDHITWLATGMDDEDERKKLDRISQKLKLLAKELRFCLVVISHVNDDGKTRGSRNISKAANTVISLDRDILGDSQFMEFMVEKARLGGRTGPAGAGFFDREAGVLRDEPVMTKGED